MPFSPTADAYAIVKKAVWSSEKDEIVDPRHIFADFASFIKEYME
jgi:hypothetical protein